MPKGKSMGRGKQAKALESSDRGLFVFWGSEVVFRYVMPKNSPLVTYEMRYFS